MKTKSVKFNLIMNMILTISGFIFPLITFPYISRILLPIGTGKVNFATALISYFTMFAQLGVPTYGIVTCAKVRDDKLKLSKVVHELLIINVFMSIVSYLVLFISLLVIPKLQEDRLLYLVTSSNIVLVNIGMEWLYKALEQYSYITIRSLIFKLISLIAMFLLVHQQSDYIIYAGISVFSSAASNILNLVHSRKFVSYKWMSQYNIKKHLKPIGIFFAMTCAVTVYTNLDTVMLKFMTDDAEVGIYTAATKIKLILATVVSSLGAVLLPRVSYYVKNDMKEEFHRITAKAIKFVFVISLPLIMYFIIFATDSILFIAGKEYLKSVISMRIILPTILFIGLSNILGIQILVPLGREKIVLYSELIGAVVDLILNLILIPLYASAGAAIGTLVAEFAVLIFQFLFLKKEVLEIIKSIKYWKYFIALGVATLLSICFLFLNINSFWTILISGIIFFISYFIFLILLKEQLVVEICNQMMRKIGLKSIL